MPEKPKVEQQIVGRIVRELLLMGKSSLGKDELVRLDEAVAEELASHAPTPAPPLDKILAGIALRIRWDDVQSVQHGDRTPFLDAMRRLAGAPTPAPEPTATQQFHINICQQCLNLEGECCNNPHCIFCRRTMQEVGEYLDMLLIRPIIDGVRMETIPTVAAPAAAQGAPDGHEVLCQACSLLNQGIVEACTPGGAEGSGQEGRKA